jgi:hypothetical protein
MCPPHRTLVGVFPRSSYQIQDGWLVAPYSQHNARYRKTLSLKANIQQTVVPISRLSRTPARMAALRIC